MGNGTELGKGKSGEKKKKGEGMEGHLVVVAYTPDMKSGIKH